MFGVIACEGDDFGGPWDWGEQFYVGRGEFYRTKVFLWFGELFEGFEEIRAIFEDFEDCFGWIFDCFGGGDVDNAGVGEDTAGDGGFVRVSNEFHIIRNPSGLKGQ